MRLCQREETASRGQGCKLVDPPGLLQGSGTSAHLNLMRIDGAMMLLLLYTSTETHTSFREQNACRDASI